MELSEILSITQLCRYKIAISLIATLLDFHCLCCQYFYLLLVGCFHRFNRTHRNWFNENSNCITSSTSVFPQRQQLQPVKVGSGFPMPHSSIIYPNTSDISQKLSWSCFPGHTNSRRPPNLFVKSLYILQTLKSGEFHSPTRAISISMSTWARCRSGSTSASWRRRSLCSRSWVARLVLLSVSMQLFPRLLFCGALIISQHLILACVFYSSRFSGLLITEVP